MGYRFKSSLFLMIHNQFVAFCLLYIRGGLWVQVLVVSDDSQPIYIIFPLHISHLWEFKFHIKDLKAKICITFLRAMHRYMAFMGAWDHLVSKSNFDITFCIHIYIDHALCHGNWDMFFSCLYWSWSTLPLQIRVSFLFHILYGSPKTGECTRFCLSWRWHVR